MSEPWRKYLLDGDEEAVANLVRSLKRVAVLGIKTEEQATQPGFYVPRYLADVGVEVVPVPVYYPEATMILGRAVYRKLADVPGKLDLVDVFRRAGDIPAHLTDLLACRPRAVWFQQGIRNQPIALELAQAGIYVVQDRCLMVEHQRYA